MIDNITSNEREALGRARINTVEDFEKRLDSDSPNVLAALCADTGIGEDRLAQLLANSLQKTGKPLKRDLSKHWLDVFVLAILAAIVFLVGKPWWFPPKLPRWSA